jgi:hypothetical protein
MRPLVEVRVTCRLCIETSYGHRPTLNGIFYTSTVSYKNLRWEG